MLAHEIVDRFKKTSSLYGEADRLVDSLDELDPSERPADLRLIAEIAPRVVPSAPSGQRAVTHISSNIAKAIAWVTPRVEAIMMCSTPGSPERVDLIVQSYEWYNRSREDRVAFLATYILLARLELGWLRSPHLIDNIYHGEST